VRRLLVVRALRAVVRRGLAARMARVFVVSLLLG
jgi:hypothetical protein